MNPLSSFSSPRTPSTRCVKSSQLPKWTAPGTCPNRYLKDDLVSTRTTCFRGIKRRASGAIRTSTSAATDKGGTVVNPNKIVKSMALHSTLIFLDKIWCSLVRSDFIFWSRTFHLHKFSVSWACRSVAVETTLRTCQGRLHIDSTRTRDGVAPVLRGRAGCFETRLFTSSLPILSL